MEELRKIPFKWQGHMAAEGEHTLTYYNKEYGISFCEHQPYNHNGDPCGHKYTHFMYRMKVYKSARAFLNAYNKEKVHFIDEVKSGKEVTI